MTRRMTAKEKVKRLKQAERLVIRSTRFDGTRIVGSELREDGTVLVSVQIVLPVSELEEPS